MSFIKKKYKSACVKEAEKIRQNAGEKMKVGLLFSFYLRYCDTEAQSDSC